MKDTALRGCNIPKNAMVISNYWSASYDPKYWESPTEFRPERCIDASGKIIKNDAFIPFGIGPRQCLGKLLGEMEHFLVFVNLLQKFRFEREDMGKSNSLDSVIRMATNVPHPYKTRVYRRE